MLLAILFGVWAKRRNRKDAQQAYQTLADEISNSPTVYHVPESQMQAEIRQDTERDMSEWLREVRERR